MQQLDGLTQKMAIKVNTTVKATKNSCFISHFVTAFLCILNLMFFVLVLSCDFMGVFLLLFTVILMFVLILTCEAPCVSV